MSHKSVALISHVGRNVPNEIAHPLIFERLKRRIVVSASGCWLWQGPTSVKGYGWASYKGKGEHAHRVMYRVTKGDGHIPKGWYDICHTCDTPSCVNPDHLFLGTRADNVQDMRAKRRGNHQKKTACVYGHPFTPENTQVTRQGFRQCRTCARIRQRVNAGWPRELAESLPPTPHGHRPVNGSFKRL